MSARYENQKIDGFAIRERIHAGGMATLYRVEYDTQNVTTSPGFPMVMKIPRMTSGDGGENIISFEIEQQILAAVTGPHVPRFVAAGDLDKLPYLVMEYIPGDTLEQVQKLRLDSGKTFSAAEVAKIGAAIARAAHSLHKQNVCHLDLKPANLLFRAGKSFEDPSTEVVMLDFGLSCHAHYPDLMAEELRKAVGSPSWIAPEQVVGVRGDPRSDVFAIGVMLYELVTGELPFGSPSTNAGLRQRLWMTPKPPRAIVPELEPWLQEIILRCLEPEAQARYPSAAQLAMDLNNPEQVRLTQRAESVQPTSFWIHLKRWIKAAGMEYKPSPLPETQINSAPIVLVAVPHQDTTDTILFSLREAVQRSMGLRPGARLAVVTVIKSGLLSGNSNAHETDLQRKYLNWLKQWAQPLELDALHVSFHVLEANDVAQALLAYAHGNQINLIIMGAATHGLQMQRVKPTVPIKVAMHAPCSVMLVKANTPFEHLPWLEEQPIDDGLDAFKTW